MTLDLFETAKSKFIESNAIIINDSKNSFTKNIIYNISVETLLQLVIALYTKGQSETSFQTEFMIQFNTYFIENSVNDKTKFNYHAFSKIFK